MQRQSKRQNLQLHIVVEQPDLLTRLESRHADVRTSIATESVSKTAIPTRAYFALNSEIYLSKVISS